MSNGLISVMLVDDHAVVRMGFRLLLGATTDIRVTGEAASGEEACGLIAQALPDVIVMDISMPGMGGIQAVERITSRHPKARILVLSAHRDAIHVRRALDAGARGYLCKRTAPEALCEAIRRIAKGERFLDHDLAQQVALHGVAGNGDPVRSLSSREFEVFLQLANGRTVSQIAEILRLSASTVGTHLYNIKQKLGAATSAEIAMIAVRNGLIEV